MKAVIDRFEGDFAIVLVGDEEVEVEIPKSLIPKGAVEGSWLDLGLELDQDGTDKQREKISKLLDKLKRK